MKLRLDLSQSHVRTWLPDGVQGVSAQSLVFASTLQIGFLAMN